MKKGGYLYLIFTLIIVLAVRTNAQTINARFTTSAYTWEQQENDSLAANHLRAYQLAQLSIGNLGLTNLSFHTYLSLSGDFAEEAKDDPRFWIYNCYFKYKNLFKSIDLGFGRQRIYAGVGYGTIDGLQVEYGFKDYFQVKAYVGTLAPLRKSTEIEDFNSDNLSYGFHLTTNKLKKIKIGLSFANLSRTPIRYSSPGIFTGNFRIENPVSPIQRQLMGLDLSSQLTKNMRLNGRLDFNLISENIQRGEFGWRYYMKNFEIGLDYIYRMPYIDFNSIFSVFALNSNQEIAFNTNYRLNDHRFFLNLSSTFFDDDDNLRFGVGWSWKFIYLGYNKRSGYGGDSDGVFATFNYFVMDKLSVSLSSNFASYRLISTAADRDQVLAESIGFSYNPTKKLALQAEAQYLNNKKFSSDIRLFLRASYAFFKRF